MGQGKRRTLGGPRYNKPHEVHDQLNTLGKNYNQFYDDIMRHAVVRWDLDTHDVWVKGRFRASKMQMYRWTGLAKSSFYIKWQNIIDAKLIEEGEDDIWVLTRIIRKEDVAVNDADVRRIQEQQLGVIEDLRDVKAILAEWQKDRVLPAHRKEKDLPEDENTSGVPEERGSSPEERGSSPDSDILLKVFLNKKTSHCSLDSIITGFYRQIGQNKIPSGKRERGFNIGRKLREDGFSLEDIQFAVDWIIKNAEKEPYDFSIVEHTIAQALGTRDKLKLKTRLIEEHDKVIEEEDLKRETEERGREEVEAQKASLSPDERKELREEAQAELVGEGVPAGFINDFLLNLKENEILRKKGLVRVQVSGEFV